MFFSLKINTGSVGSEDPLETLFAKLDPRIRQDPLGSVVADRPRTPDTCCRLCRIKRGQSGNLPVPKNQCFFQVEIRKPLQRSFGF